MLNGRGNAPSKRWRLGFTLIELIVVMSIVALMLSLVAPRYFRSVDKAKEVALKANLQMLRGSIDKFYTDKGRYPDSLDSLVIEHYLREVPQDPVMESNVHWILIRHPEGQSGVFDVKSGSDQIASDGSAIRNW